MSKLLDWHDGTCTTCGQKVRVFVWSHRITQSCGHPWKPK